MPRTRAQHRREINTAQARPYDIEVDDHLDTDRSNTVRQLISLSEELQRGIRTASLTENQISALHFRIAEAMQQLEKGKEKGSFRSSNSKLGQHQYRLQQAEELQATLPDALKARGEGMHTLIKDLLKVDNIQPEEERWLSNEDRQKLAIIAQDLKKGPIDETVLGELAQLERLLKFAEPTLKSKELVPEPAAQGPINEKYIPQVFQKEKDPNAPDDLHVHIRWMIRRDMDEVLEMEEAAFEHPWTEQDFIQCLRQRNCIGMVAEYDEKVVGYMVYELHKNRLHLLNMATDMNPDHNVARRGVGKQMIGKLVSKLSHQRRNRISFEIREGNLPGQMFLQKCGFKAVSVLRDYFEPQYNTGDEDAYLMQYKYDDGTEGGLVPHDRITRLAG